MAAHVLALCNQKGGVGKTTLTCNLAAALARDGLRVLVVDCDPQANATAQLNVGNVPFTLNDALTSVDPATGRTIPGVLADAVVPAGHGWDGIDVIAAEAALAAREQDQTLGREQRLRTALTGTLERWDVVLLDCPPSLGQLTVNALTAADAALVVTEPRASSVEGMAAMVRILTSVRDLYNSRLRLAGVLVNRHRPERRDVRTWTDKLHADYGPDLLHPFIPEREVLAVAASDARPLSSYGRSAQDVTDAVTMAARKLMTGVAG